jgi:hypothetical protein
MESRSFGSIGGQSLPKRTRGFASAPLRYLRWIESAGNVENAFLKLGHTRPMLDDVTDNFASIHPTTPSHVKGTFVRLFDEVVDDRDISIALLDDLLLYTLREAGNLVVDLNGLIAGERPSET